MKPPTQLDKNWLEWLVFAFGCVLVTSVIGYLVYASFSVGDSPAQFRIELGQPQSEGKNFRVPVTVHNDGDQTAEGVQIEVVAGKGSSDEEVATFEMAFLPRHSSREGEVVFEKDPQQGTLNARVTRV